MNRIDDLKSHIENCNKIPLEHRYLLVNSISSYYYGYDGLSLWLASLSLSWRPLVLLWWLLS